MAENQNNSFGDLENRGTDTPTLLSADEETTGCGHALVPRAILPGTFDTVSNVTGKVLNLLLSTEEGGGAPDDTSGDGSSSASDSTSTSSSQDPSLSSSFPDNGGTSTTPSNDQPTGGSSDLSGQLSTTAADSPPPSSNGNFLTPSGTVSAPEVASPSSSSTSGMGSSTTPSFTPTDGTSSSSTSIDAGTSPTSSSFSPSSPSFTDTDSLSSAFSSNSQFLATGGIITTTDGVGSTLVLSGSDGISSLSSLQPVAATVGTLTSLSTRTTTIGSDSVVAQTTGTTTNAPSAAGGSNSNKNGALAGGIVGAFLALGLLIVLSLCFIRKRKVQREREELHDFAAALPPSPVFQGFPVTFDGASNVSSSHDRPISPRPSANSHLAFCYQPTPSNVPNSPPFNSMSQAQLSSSTFGTLTGGIGVTQQHSEGYMLSPPGSPQSPGNASIIARSISSTAAQIARIMSPPPQIPALPGMGGAGEERSDDFFVDDPFRKSSPIMYEHRVSVISNAESVASSVSCYIEEAEEEQRGEPRSSVDSFSTARNGASSRQEHTEASSPSSSDSISTHHSKLGFDTVAITGGNTTIVTDPFSDNSRESLDSHSSAITITPDDTTNPYRKFRMDLIQATNRDSTASSVRDYVNAFRATDEEPR
ncbi:hypothetical protein T439DRAFT_377045 [Meredithblackwellia eburnea MCA 4105]